MAKSKKQTRTKRDDWAKAVAAGSSSKKPIEVADANLKLAMLAVLMDAGVIPKVDGKALQKEFPPDEDDMDDLWDRRADEDDPDLEPTEIDIMYVFNQNVARHLAGLPITEDEAAAILKLAGPTDVPLNLTPIIFPQWDGEDETFKISNLAGIEHCVSLDALDLSSCMVTDLKPLLALPALRSLEISWDSDTKGVDRIKSTNESLIDALEKRDVKVKVSWP
jgi:hypothetical protein